MPGWIALLKNRTVPLCANSDTHEDFKTGHKKLIPMINAHGEGVAAYEYIYFQCRFNHMVSS